jgi:hypothetical protein
MLWCMHRLRIWIIFIFFSGTCGHFKQFEELTQQVKQKLPDAEIKGREGRRGM